LLLLLLRTLLLLALRVARQLLHLRRSLLRLAPQLLLCHLLFKRCLLVALLRQLLLTPRPALSAVRNASSIAFACAHPAFARFRLLPVLVLVFSSYPIPIEPCAAIALAPAAASSATAILFCRMLLEYSNQRFARNSD